MNQIYFFNSHEEVENIRMAINYKTAGMSKSRWINICTSILIAIFTYAAISKLMDFHSFRRQLFLSPLLNPFGGFVAWFIPFSELVAVWLLFSLKNRILGFYFSFSLMVLFTSYIYYILHFSAEIPCSCGGLLQHMGWKVHLVFNTILLMISATPIFLYAANTGNIDITKQV